jgi:hypothetical protein
MADVLTEADVVLPAPPAPISIVVPVLQMRKVLEKYDQIKVFRSTTGVNGTYSEITTVDTRPRLEQNKTYYEYLDLTGDASYWYASKFYRSGSTPAVESSMTRPRKGFDVAALANVMTVEDLQAVYLFGVDLTNDEGEPFPDLMYLWAIAQAAATLALELDITILKTIFDERYDYFRRDYQEWCALQLRHVPVISVESIDVMWPSDVKVITFDSSWIHLRKESGQIHVIPAAGTISQVLLTAGGSFLPLLAQGRDMIPDMFRIQYTAGWADGEVPNDIRHCIGMLAAILPLDVAGDLISGAGVASSSISMDGLSQSISTTSSAENAGYSARITHRYLPELKERLKEMKRYYRGIKMVTL